jgi:hypothetical protein
MSRSAIFTTSMEDFFRPRLSAKSRVGRPSEVATTSRWPQQLLRERSWTEAPAPALISKLDTHDTKSMTGDIVATERTYGGVVLYL